MSARWFKWYVSSAPNSPQSPVSAPVAIIGGGISGLAAAHYLRASGISSVVIEASSSLGGLLCTERIHNCTIETGADSWLAQKPWARELAAELGLASDIIGSNDALRHISVLRRGKLVPFPKGLQLIVPKRLKTVWTSPLFSLTTKLRMTADWRRHDSGNRPDRSVADFIRDHFGQGAIDYLAEPLLTGIYGGDPENLSAVSVLPKLVERERRQGSLTRGLAQEPDPVGSVFESMRGGLGQLIAALKPEQLIHGQADSIARNGQAWQVRVDGNWLHASQVIIACPAHRAAVLLAELDAPLSNLLSTIQHSSAHIVAMAFRNLDLFKGFGLLVPKIERRNLMAATWVHNKFLGRAAQGTQLVRCFFRQPTDQPVQELQQLLQFKKEPEFIRTYQWPKSLPQYAVGHTTLVADLESRTAQFPGLHLIGNAYHGVGIPDCVRLARQTASNIARYD